jgi:hypothetical protein
MTEPSTPDNWRPSPRPRAAATTTSQPIAWPVGDPVQVIPVEPFDELRQLREFRASVASVLRTSSLDHDEIRRELDRLVVERGIVPLAAQRAFDTLEHLPCIGDCPGRQVAEPGRWCSFCTAKQVLADALAEVGPAAVHVVHRDGELLHAALDVDAARQWATEARQDGLSLTTLEVR